MRIHSLPIGYGLKWLTLTWDFVKQNYGVVLAITLLVMFLNSVIGSEEL